MRLVVEVVAVAVVLWLHRLPLRTLSRMGFLDTAAAFTTSTTTSFTRSRVAPVLPVCGIRPTWTPPLLFQKHQHGRTHAVARSRTTKTTTTTTALSLQKQPQQHHLVIVESPAKCATIEKILNSAAASSATSNTDKNIHPTIVYTVRSCMGHIRNLPKTKKQAAAAGQPPPLKKTSRSKKTQSASAVKPDPVAPELSLLEAPTVVSEGRLTAIDDQQQPSTTNPHFDIVGIDWNGGRYTPQYAILEGRQRTVVRELQELVHTADQVLLATDPDREGEAMAWHLAVVLNLTPAANPTTATSIVASSSTDTNNNKKDNSNSGGSSKKKSKPYYRIRFAEITSQAILSAVQATMTVEGHGNENDEDGNAKSLSSSSSAMTTRINEHLVAAQETRRVLDRLAGYTVSPVLWKKIAPGLSAGRVQSVGLAMIVQRELARLSFESVRYHDIKAIIQTSSKFGYNKNDSNGNGKRTQQPGITARLTTINGTAVANTARDFTTRGRVLTAASKHKYHLETDSDVAQWVNRLLSSSSDDNANGSNNEPAAVWTVVSVRSHKRVKKAPRPYKTSTLQQEAARRLGLPVQQTMRAAQQLYEAGCISYMRTDSTALSQESIQAVESTVQSSFGKHMLSNAAAVPLKDKFSQEAHEAIRPAIQSNGLFLKPSELPSTVVGYAVIELYRMIYQRTISYRMQPLITNQTQVVIGARIDSSDTLFRFRTSGSVVVSPGYTLAYDDQEMTLNSDSDQNSDNDGTETMSQTLPSLVEGQILHLRDLFPVEHETQPPPRFTEASFVKELEALGVGRPSTYAGIVQTLRDRAYVGSPGTAKDGRRRHSKGQMPTGSAISALRAAGGEEFTGGGGSGRGPLVPSLSAIVVCALLEKHCPSYVDPSFTAQMETRLDLIAAGDSEGDYTPEEQRVAYLQEFYAGEDGLAAQVKLMEDTVDASVARRAVLPALQNDDGMDKVESEVGLFIGPWGPYVQRVGTEFDSNEKAPSAPLPPAMAADISTIKPEALRALLATKQGGGVLLGQHPDDGRNIRLKTGRFGAYLQWGDDDEAGATNHSLPRNKTRMRQIETHEKEDDDAPVMEASLDALLGVTLEDAIAYVGLPRTVTVLADKPIIAAIGPYGPYLKYNSKFLSLKEKDGDVLTIDAETAVELVTDGIINKANKLGRGVLANLGEKEGSMISVKTGKFGTFLKWDKVNVQLPNEYIDTPKLVPFEDAWRLIQEKRGPIKIRKPKSKKDADENFASPPSPKRPTSAYLYFCAAKRPEVSQTIKTLGEMSKVLSSLWAQTTAEDRMPYEQLAVTGKAEYEAKVRVWKEECHSQSKDKKVSKRISKRKTVTVNGSLEDKPPIRAASAYVLFCREFRPLMVDESTGKKLPLGEATKRLASRWRDSDNETKAKFHQLPEEEKEKLLVSE